MTPIDITETISVAVTSGVDWDAVHKCMLHDEDATMSQLALSVGVIQRRGSVKLDVVNQVVEARLRELQADWTVEASKSIKAANYDAHRKMFP